VEPGDLVEGGFQLGPLPSYDGRTAALERLRLFCSLLRFRRRSAKGEQAIEFRVRFEDVLTEWPDNEHELHLPAIAFTPGIQTQESYLGPPIVDETSIDVFGKGTALQRLADTVEPFMVEVWGASKAERQALVVGLKVALRGGEDSYALRLSLPNYYNLVASFSLDEVQNYDDADIVRNRRRAGLRVTMTVPEVRLVSYPALRPLVEVDVRAAAEVVDASNVIDEGIVVIDDGACPMARVI